MSPCPICQSEEVICSGDPRFHVEGRPTALCPHAEAHARAGIGPHPVTYFADTGELVRRVKRKAWEVIYAAGQPTDLLEKGRRFAGTFLAQFAGIFGLNRGIVDQLSADLDLAGLLPKPRVMATAEAEGWPVLMAPLYGEDGLIGVEIRTFCPEPAFRPGEPAPRKSMKSISTVGRRGVYLTETYGSPRVIVLFEGIWDAVCGRWDAFERESGEFVFGGISANTSADVVRGALRRFYPGIPVVLVGDRDRPGVQAMARLKKFFPGVVLPGLNDEEGKGPKDYREADPERRWAALLTAVEEGIAEWDRRKLGGDSSGRREIIVKPPEHEMVREAIDVLDTQGGFYLQGQRMVFVWKNRGKKDMAGLKIPAGSPVIREATAPWLREQLSQHARFVKESEEGLTKECMVPVWFAPLVMASSKAQRLPVLQALVEVPVLLPDGTILEDPGMDYDSGIFFAPVHPFPPMPDEPSHEEAIDAANRLLDLVSDFPFAANPSPQAHRAAWLAFALTPFARYAIHGPVPFVFLEANGPSSGKGLLAQMTGQLALGRPLPVGVAPKEGDELMKMALSSLRDGVRMVFLDEAPSPFGSRQWNALVTAYPMFEGRVLGQTASIQVPQNAVWVTTGNNVVLSADGVRRCLHIRLEPQVEKPEERTGFKIDNLVRHVRKHHSDLVCDALTILRAYHVAGRPSFGLKPWGSFEEWSDLVRNAVYWVLGVDCDTRDALAVRSDTTRGSQGALVHGLVSQFGTNPFTTEEVWAIYSSQSPQHRNLIDALEELNANPKGINPKSLGRLLLRTYNTVHGGWQLDLQDVKRAGSRVWILRRVPSNQGSGGFEGNGGSDPRPEVDARPPSVSAIE
jgi:hypothetical protein